MQQPLRPAPTLLAVAAALLAPALSAAQTAGAPPEAPAGAAAWDVSAGAAIIAVPRTLGAERRRTLLLPAFEARRNDGLFVSFDKGVGIERPAGENLKLSAGLAVDLGSRRRKDDVRFSGLQDLHESLAVRLGADVDVGPVGFSGTLQSRLTQRREAGTTASADLTYALVSGEAGQLAVGLTGRWMDARYANSFLSINDAQSAASGLPFYRAGAGLLDAGWLVQGVLRLSETWTLFGRGGVARLSSAAAGSPVVRTRDSRVFILSVSRSL